MLTLTPTKVPERLPLSVTLDGKEIGTIYPYEADQWHTCINLPLSAPVMCDSTTLIQGFGDSPAAAIADAIDKGWKYHQRALEAVRVFAERQQ